MSLLQILVFVTFAMLALGVAILARNFQIPAKMRKAEELFEAGADFQASDIVKAVLDKKKDFIPARYLRARMLSRSKQYILAIAEFNAILQLPDFGKFVSELEIHRLLAELYNLTQQWQKEVESYKMILSFNPDDVQANYRVGMTYFKQSRHKECRDTLMRAVAKDPSLVDCFLPLGISCYHLAEYTNAEEFLLKSIERPNQSGIEEGYYFLGLIYKGKRDFDAAIKMFEAAKRDKKLFIKALYKVGEIYYETENFDQAITALESGLGSLKVRDEDSLAYRYLLAECYEMENKVQEAVHHWDKIQSEHPNYRSTQMKLDDYKTIISDESMKSIFSATIDELQPILAEVVSRLNFNIIHKTILSSSQIVYKAYNTKRINDPPILIYFIRTTREIPESSIARFHGMITEEKCKTGIFITTSRYSPKAKTSAQAKSIEIYDREIIIKSIGGKLGRK
jgi:tetratricopeptide (TPR) repeat protein